MPYLRPTTNYIETRLFAISAGKQGVRHAGVGDKIPQGGNKTKYSLIPLLAFLHPYALHKNGNKLRLALLTATLTHQ